jgi:hypothetical protein
MWQILSTLADRVQLMRRTLPGLFFMNLISTGRPVSRFGCSPVGARMDSYQSASQKLSSVTAVRRAYTREHRQQRRLYGLSALVAPLGSGWNAMTQGKHQPALNKRVWVNACPVHLLPPTGKLDTGHSQKTSSCLH